MIRLLSEENFLKSLFIIQSKFLRKLASFVFFVLLWYIIAAVINAPLILPFPHQVLIRLIHLCRKADFWLSFLFTFIRVNTAFYISLVLGFFLGLLSADFSFVKDLLEVPLSVIRTVPVISFILLALFWFSSDIVPVFVAVLMSLPVMLSACEKGFEKNNELKEKLFKAECAGFTGIKAFRYIRFPIAFPSVYAGAEASFGLCWKVVAAAEVLSLPKMAAGAIMQKAQVHLETADVLAVTIMLVFVSLFFQKILTKIRLSSILYKSV